MKTSSSFTNLIQSCDFIGEKPGLYIKKSKKYKTTLGGFLCILIYLTLLLALLYFSQDLVFLQYPSESMSTMFTNHPSPISLLSDDKRKSVDFQVSVSKGKEELGFEYFTLQANQIVEVVCSEYGEINMTDVVDIKDIYRIYNANQTISQIENMNYTKDSQIPDNSKNIINDYKEAYSLCTSNQPINQNDKFRKIIIKKEINLSLCKSTESVNRLFVNNSLCISDKNNKSDIQVYGNKHFSFHKYITLTLLKCSSNCPKDNDEVWESNEISLSVYFTKYIVDLKSYSSPIYPVKDSFRLGFMKGFQSFHSIILKNIYVNTDIGYILEDFRQEEHIGISSHEFNLHQTIQVNSNPTISKVEVVIENSHTVEVIYRKYIKVQRILAEVGGLFKTFLIISLFLNYFHNRASYYEYLFNELFCLEDLGKYFQYFDPSLRSKFGRHRDSIILRNTKSETLIKKADQNFFSSNMNNNNHSDFKKGNSIFTISNMNNINNQQRPDLADKTREKLLFNTTKMSKSSDQNNKYIHIVNENENSKENDKENQGKTTNNEKKMEEIVNLMKMSSIQIENYKHESDNNDNNNNFNESLGKNEEKINKSKKQFVEKAGIFNNDMNNINQISLYIEKDKKDEKNENENNNLNNESVLNNIIKDYDDKAKENLIMNIESDQSLSIISSNDEKRKVNQQVKKEENEKEEKFQMTQEDIEDAENFYINKLIHDQKAKENFIKSKNKTFTLTAYELFKYLCCSKNERKRNILFGGLEMIKERMEEANLMKKNLELDRFKNLMLKDEQLLLLDSLSKYMLDPERAKLVDINQCGYEKFIDAYSKIFKSNNCVDVTLSKWVRTKYQLKL